MSVWGLTDEGVFSGREATGFPYEKGRGVGRKGDLRERASRRGAGTPWKDPRESWDSMGCASAAGAWDSFWGVGVF